MSFPQSRFRGRCCVAAMLSLVALCAGASWGATTLTPGVTLVPVAEGYSRANLSTNGYICSSLVTFGNTQYIVFYKDAGVHLMLGKRTLGTTAWTFNDTGLTPYNNTDGHNTISMGVDGEGVVHLAWGVHNNPGNYARGTAPGALTVTKQPLPFADREITYPRFTHLPNGDLLFDYRAGGGSGNANHYLNYWSLATHTWTPVNGNGVPFIKGQTPGMNSPNGNTRNPYLNYLVLDSKNNLICTFNWCEDYTSVDWRHDELYARSPDYGKTWLKMNGTPYTLPITVDTAEKVWEIPINMVLINQAGGAVDMNDHPYIATWWAPKGTGTPVQLFVLWHDGKTWQAKQLTNRITNTTGMGADIAKWPSRPIIVCDKKNNLFVVSHDLEWGGKPQLFWCTDPARQAWQQTELTSDNLGSFPNWEPTFDPTLWQRENKLNLFYQKCITGTDTSPISVLEFDPAVFLQAPPARTPR